MDVRPLCRQLFNQVYLLTKETEKVNEQLMSEAPPRSDLLDVLVRIRAKSADVQSILKNPTTDAIKAWIKGADVVTNEDNPKPEDLTDQKACLKYCAGVLSSLGVKVSFGWLTNLLKQYSLGGSYGPVIQVLDEFQVRASDPGFDPEKLTIPYITGVVRGNMKAFFQDSQAGPKCPMCDSPSQVHEVHDGVKIFICSKSHKFKGV